MTRALARFTVAAGGIRLRVRVLPTMRDVDAEYRDGDRPRRDGKLVPAFFAPARRTDAKHLGTVVLCADGCAEELVPHEIAHAVVHAHQSVTAADDERFATTVGLLSARVHRHLRRLEVRP